MHIRFDSNDDLVIDDIPDDIMTRLEETALARGRTTEDEMRDLLEILVANWKGSDDQPR